MDMHTHQHACHLINTEAKNASDEKMLIRNTLSITHSIGLSIAAGPRSALIQFQL
jgi:hypothetical protein